MAERKVVDLDRGWGILLRDLGIQAENVLRRARLPLDLLVREQGRVSLEEYSRLWNAIEAEANDPELPIRIGLAMTPEAFHPSIFAALCSPNLRLAIKRIAKYKQLVAPMTLEIKDHPDGFFVGMRWNDPGVELPPMSAVTELVFLTQIARIGSRELIRPLRVTSPHPMDPEEAYREYFGVAPELSDRHGVTFRPADANRPFLTASESMWETFEPTLRHRLTRLQASAPLSERVRSVLLESLPSGEASIDVSARRLGLSPRTLQRRLLPEGTSYKEIVRSTREKLARHYLTNTSLSYVEIAFLLGYEEPSSFFRAFRSWTGSTPETVRYGDPVAQEGILSEAGSRQMENSGLASG